MRLALLLLLFAAPAWGAGAGEAPEAGRPAPAESALDAYEAGAQDEGAAQGGAGGAEPEEPGATAAPTFPVVCYHRFNDNPSDRLALPPKRFAEQLRWLKRRGYETISLDQARRFIRGDLAGLPAKPVMLTIDDGYRDGLTVAAPILKRYGYKAVYFVNSSQVAQSITFLNWKDLKALLDHGHEIASHTSRHTNLARPTKGESPAAYQARLASELQHSRLALESRLGITVTALAYPYGAFNPWVQEATRQAGYDFAFSVSGGVNVPGDHPLSVRRILLMNPLKDGSFARRVRERRLHARVEGLEEGMGLHPADLPRDIRLKLPQGWKEGDELRALIEGAPMRLKKAEGGWVATIRKEIKPGFYFFRLEAGFGRELGRDAYLFQVFKKGLEGHFAKASPTAGVNP